ncbi:MAG: hypothetical protein DRQ02_00930 [Candidatus Latescibacterota bacterium]|nr:MAG: hypothetical protein DRQ02_00930 [Candidatus Latescibacterota bacterium]
MGEIITAGNGKRCLSPEEKCRYFLEPIRGDISIVEVSGKCGIGSSDPKMYLRYSPTRSPHGVVIRKSRKKDFTVSRRTYLGLET